MSAFRHHGVLGYLLPVLSHPWGMHPASSVLFLQCSKISWTYLSLLYPLTQVRLPAMWTAASKQVQVSQTRKAALNLIAEQLVGVETIPMEIIPLHVNQVYEGKCDVAAGGPDKAGRC